MITGTPAMSRPIELYNLLLTLRPNVFMNFAEFANRYCNPKPRTFGYPGIDYSGSSNV
jgi:SWI/SNF-related matrix-associated actin-dependent regulator 1 of chromatin subfamily A